MNAIVIEKGNGANPEDFLSLAWVLRARAKDESRLNLCGLHSDGMGRFAATDGNRLHVAEIPKMAEAITEGTWLFVHASATKISLMQAPDAASPYPNYQKAIDLFNSAEPIAKGSIFHVKGELSMTVWRFADMVSQRINIDYMIDALDKVDAMNIRVTASHVEFSQENGNSTRKAIIGVLKQK